MSQYAYIPVERVKEVTLKYSITGPEAWQFEKDGVLYGGFEEFLFTTEQKEEIESLGGQWFESGEEFKSWVSNHEDPIQQVAADKIVGQKALNTMIAKLDFASMNDTDIDSFLTKFQKVKTLAELGQLQRADAYLKSLQEDKFFSAEVKAVFDDLLKTL